MNNHNPLKLQNQNLLGRLWSPPKISLLAAGLLLGSMLGASAADVRLKTADNAGTSSITGSTNWSDGLPASAANAYYTTNFVIRTPAVTVSGSNYIFNGGSLSIDPGGRFLGKIGNNVGGNTVSGTVTITNLILNGGQLDQAGANSDNSYLTLAGNVNVVAPSTIGALGGTANNSASFETVDFTATISGSAALQVSGANINAGGDTGVIKLSAANPYSGVITVTNGANVIASAVNRLLQLNNLNAASNATLNLVHGQPNPVSFASGVNSGPFNVGGLTGRVSQTLNDTAGSPVTLSVGGNGASTTYTGPLTDSGNLVKVGAGTLTLTGTNTYFGTTTVNGGTLQLGNGGAIGSITGGGALTVNGNLTINRNNTVTQGTDFSGSAITGTGSFTQAGSGTTILNAANSYSGTTTISAGKLVVSSAQTGTGAFTVANGTRLGVIVSGISQLSPSTLTLGTSAATILDLDGVNSTTIPPINAGNVSVGGQVTININTGTFAAGNSYPLIHWTGSGPANASSFTLGVSPGLTATFSVSGGTLFLNVSAVSDIWNGTIDGNWNTTTANWTGNSTVFANGQSVLFDDAATGTTSVTVASPVQPGNILINNSALTYSIASSGANKIGGTSGLTKQNTGSITLSGGVNNYTGVTAVNGGLLSVSALANGGQPSDIGAASTASANLVLNGGTLQYTGGNVGTDRGATVGASGGTVEVSSFGVVLANSGTIAGSGVLTKTGNGTLTLSGANTFSGGVSLNAGQLNIDNGGSSSANSAIGTGTLTIAADTTIDNTSGGNVTLLPNNAQVWNANLTYAGSANNLNLGTGPVTLSATRTVTVNNNTLTLGGNISGNAGLTKLGAGTLVLLGASTYGNNGGFDTAHNGGTLVIGNDFALGSSRLNMADGVTIQSADSTAHTLTNNLNFGSGAGGNNIFAGTGNLKFTASAANGSSKVLTVNNPQTEFSGVLSGVMARTVAGTGVLVFSGANTYSLGTTINPGATLQLGNGGTTGSISTSGNIVNDGTLRFNRSDALVQGTHFSSAPITGAGAVVQAGSGTTTLTAANTYSGLTTINNGELFITPAYQGGGDVTVANNAKFGVAAAAVTNSATIGNLTLGAGGATTLDFSYSFTGNPTNAALFANSITINGSSAIRIGGTFAVGTFPVVKYNSLSGAFSGTVAGPRGTTATLSNDVVNKVLYVTVSSLGNGIVWTGTNSLFPNLWDINNTTNWLISGSPTVYLESVPPGDAVTFNDSGASLVLLSNNVSPANVTFTNTLANYVVQGSGQINSAAGLSKTGLGSVTLNVPGTYANNTLLSGGAVSLGANQTFNNLVGNSAVNVSTNAPTITANNTTNTTFSGNISGSVSLTKTGNGTLTLAGSNSPAGTILVKAGGVTLDTGAVNQNGYTSVGHTGTDTGAMLLKGTAFYANNNDFNIGDVGAAAGSVTVQDSASLTVGSFYVGAANAVGSTASGTVTQTGGTINQTSSTTGTFAIGGRTETNSVGGVGVYNMSGGVLNTVSAIRLGAAGVGTFNQTGGAVNAGVDVNIARFTGASGTYNLDGGSLRTARVTSSAVANSTFNMNGGVLIAHDDNTSVITNLSQVNVRNGGAIVDTTNLVVTITSPLQHSSIGGDNAIDGGLTKRGSGSLTISENFSSYTGPTLVSAGTLNVYPNSVNNLNNVTVSNATLGIIPNSGLGTANAASLSLKGTSGLNFNYDLISSTPTTALNVAGALTATGTTTINIFGYGWSAGMQCVLVDYSGTPLPNLANFQLGALPYGVTAVLSNNTANSSIDLVITSSAITTWIPLVLGDPTGTSSFNSGGFWQDANAPTAANGYLTRNFGLRSPADNLAYTFGGAVLSVDTGGRFIMKGTNGQVITVNNLILNGGLVDYANGGDNFTQTLAGNITLQAGLNSYMGALGSAGASETLYVTAPIGGTGNVQFGGTLANNGGDNGVVVLAATNTYTGTTIIAGGTVLVNGANGNSGITVTGNGTLGGFGTVAGAVSVQSGASLAPGMPTRGALTAAIGTLTASSPVTIGGTAVMKIDRAAVPTSDKLAAPSVTVNPTATLTVNNLGSTNFVAGDTFTLFSTPISGAFGTLTLPQLPDPSLTWTNKLAVNGTIAVVAANAVNPGRTNIGFSVVGGNLTVTWPADHTGWTLQVQTNTRSVGLNTNWFDVPGSSTTNAVTMPVGTGNGAVFYRLKL